MDLYGTEALRDVCDDGIIQARSRGEGLRKGPCYGTSTGTRTSVGRWRRAFQNSTTTGMTEMTTIAAMMMWKFCLTPGTLFRLYPPRRKIRTQASQPMTL